MEAREIHLTSVEVETFTSTLKELRNSHGSIHLRRLITALKVNKRLQAKFTQHVEDFEMSVQERCSIFSGSIGICENAGCGNYTKWRRPQYMRFCCAKCWGPNAVANRKKTCRKKYGVAYVSQVPEITVKRSKAIRAAHAAKGTAAPRKGTFEYVAQKVRPNTGTEFYVYVLLDPRKPGNFQYGKWKFDYEPFYVGKGKGGRAFSHIRTFDIVKISNPHKKNKIRSIINEGLEPAVLIKRKDIDEAAAFELEARLIHAIGCGKLGPLVNLQRVKTGGLAGYKHTKETCNGLSKFSKQVWAGHTEEQRAARCLAISRAKGSMSAAEYSKEIKARFKTLSVSVPESTKFRMTHKVSHTCRCGHTWLATPNYVLANNGCSKCLRTGEAVELRNKRSVEAKAKRTLPMYLQHLKTMYHGAITVRHDPATFTMRAELVHTCNLGHAWTIRPRLFMRYQNGCPYCMTHTRRTSKSVLNI